nr:MAG TPA: chromosome replication initiation protein [Caudoviricetes sp.]
MKESNYITIPGFLRTRLDLKGSELIITALIYGYSQDGNSWFMGKTEYIADWAGITDKNVLRSLKSLTEKGILEKKEIFVNNKAKRCYYRFNFECVELQNSTVSGYQNSTVNNNINNNIDKDNIKPENEFSGLFPENENSANPQKLRGTTEPRKCLFENSRYAKFEDFEKCFDKPEFEQIDILYYYHSVADWSASKGRMQKDWIAQTRNFIRGDKEKGKLHLKPQYQQGKKSVDINGAMEFLNNDY